MRKRLCMVLVASVLLASCGIEPEPETKEQIEEEQISVSIETKATVNTPTETEPTEPEPEEPQEWELLVVDESGVKITAKGLKEGGIFGPELKLLIENNTGENITVQARNVSVNGFMTEVMLSAEVANGKKEIDGMAFSTSDLAACGSEVIADMEFSFHIFTSEDWETYLDTAPIQLTTGAAQDYVYKTDMPGQELYASDNFRAVLTGFSQDGSLFGPSINLYLENNSDHPITVQTRDVSVNGFMTQVIFSSEIMPGKRAMDQITFMESSLEENGITVLEETEFSFHIFDPDSRDTVIDTEPIRIDFNF